MGSTQAVPTLHGIRLDGHRKKLMFIFNSEQGESLSADPRRDGNL